MYGFVAGTYKQFPYSLFKNVAGIEPIKQILTPEPVVIMASVYSDTSNKTEVACNNIGKRKAMAILAFGQGNAANGGEAQCL